MLNLDPWWRCTLSLHYSVHEELFSGNEGISLLDKLFYRLAASLYAVKSTFLTCFLQVNMVRSQLVAQSHIHTSIRSSTKLVHPLSPVGFGRPRIASCVVRAPLMPNL